MIITFKLSQLNDKTNELYDECTSRHSYHWKLFRFWTYDVVIQPYYHFHNYCIINIIIAIAIEIYNIFCALFLIFLLSPDNYFVISNLPLSHLLLWILLLL